MSENLSHEPSSVSTGTHSGRLKFFQDPLGWMVYHSVSANLIMVLLLSIGAVLMTGIKKEVFPSFQTDRVTISVDYPGATVTSMESAAAIPIENAVATVDGIGDVITNIGAGEVVVTVEVTSSNHIDSVYRDIENKVNKIRDFPGDMPRPVIAKKSMSEAVMFLILYAKDAQPSALKEAFNRVRNAFSDDPQTGLLSAPGDSDYRIFVEVPEANLRKYGLTVAQIGQAIAVSAQDISPGTIKGRQENLELQFDSRKYNAKDFKNIVISTSEKGAPLYLSDIATVRDGFEDSVDVDITANNEPAYFFMVSPKQGETPDEVSAAVHKALHRVEGILPENIHLEILFDATTLFSQRSKVLMHEGLTGIILVIVVLSLFLEMRLAFWTSFGIPISFLGSFLILAPIMAPLTGFSINIISLFAFIIVLGIVVDDAIVVGENIYHHKELLPSDPKRATANGVKEVASAAFFSIFTNIVAFMPLMMLPGTMGKFLRQIPIVVVFVLLVSLIESLFILPARIAFANPGPVKNPLIKYPARLKKAFNNGFDWLVQVVYAKALSRISNYRYLALTVIVAVMIVFVAFMKSGKMGMVLMPESESDIITFAATFPPTSTLETKIKMRKKLVDNALEVLNSMGGRQEYKNVEADIVASSFSIRIMLQPINVRSHSAAEVSRAWEQKNAPMMYGLQQYSYSSSMTSPGGNAQLTMHFSHSSSEVLTQAVKDIVTTLDHYKYVEHAESDQASGYKRYNFSLNYYGYALGLTPASVALQVQQMLYGYTALQEIKGHNSLQVMVRLPTKEINSANAINSMVIKTPQGGLVPLADITSKVTTASEITLRRYNYKRSATVHVYINPDSKTSEMVQKFFGQDFPRLVAKYPGLQYSQGGRQQQMSKVVRGLMIGVLLTLVAIYTALAMFFDSYVQPIIIMIVIPFGFIGAILGHLVMGFPLSVPSLFGLLALSGIVVNASMIIIHFTNVYKLEHASVSSQAAIEAVCKRRFRPIMLTALTAFFGMLPTIVSSSSEVAFLRPIAVAIGFGVLFCTIVTLLFMPVFYLVFQDIRTFFRWLFTGKTEPL